jgi:hypothetical protein
MVFIILMILPLLYYLILCLLSTFSIFTYSYPFSSISSLSLFIHLSFHSLLLYLMSVFLSFSASQSFFWSFWPQE